MTDRRYRVLVGLRWGILALMVGIAIVLKLIFEPGVPTALAVAALLGFGSSVVGRSLTEAMAPWVWPEEEL